jgi:hypothetical protein
VADQDRKNLEQDSLFREIDEDLRQENLAKLWKKYGNAVIGAALALVLGVAGYKSWQSYEQNRRAEAAAAFIAAQSKAQSGETEAARKAMASLESDAPDGYALLARFQVAQLLAQDGDRAGATAAYRAIAGDSATPKLYRDLAEVLGALVVLDDADPADIRLRMAPLIGDDSPWRFTAREVTALAALRAGDAAQARELYAGLAADAATPTSLRQRAQAVAQHLKD